MAVAEQLLESIVPWAILLFEYVGVIVIVVAGVRGVWYYIHRDPLTRLSLAKGLSLGLEFKLGSEILRTVIVREFKEIGLVGAIILLRAALTVLIHWEIKNEEQAAEERQSKAEPPNMVSGRIQRPPDRRRALCYTTRWALTTRRAPLIM